MEDNTRPRTYVIATTSVDALREVMLQLHDLYEQSRDMQHRAEPAFYPTEKLFKLFDTINLHLGQGASSTDIGRLFNLMGSLSKKKESYPGTFRG